MTVPVISGYAADIWGLATAFYLFSGAAILAGVLCAFVGREASKA